MAVHKQRAGQEAGPATEGLEIRRIKDPEEPGLVAFKARILDKDGNVVKALGTMEVAEERISEEGHEAIDAEVRAWAEGLAAAEKNGTRGKG